jgi:hypothetical protein
MSTPRGVALSRDMSLASRTLQRAGAPSPAAAAAGGAPSGTGQNYMTAADPGLLQGMHSATDARGLHDVACPIYPMNLTATERLMSQVEQNYEQASYGMGAHTAPSVDLGSESLYRLQLDVNDYIENLDARMRHVVQAPNAALAKRMRETSNVPLSFLYFRLQQRMMKLSGDLTADRERVMLNRLASALSN